MPVTWKDRVETARKTDKVQLHFTEKGQGSAILLLHGFAESGFTWRYIEDELAKTHRVITLDLKGFGQSPKPKDGRYSIYDQALAVKHFIEQHRLQSVTLVGHSMGGGVALALAILARNEPWEISKLVLIDAAAYRQNLPSMIQDLTIPVIGQLGVYLISPHFQAKQGYVYAFYDDDKIPEEGVRHSAENFVKPGARYVYLRSAKQLIPEDIEKISRQYKSIHQPTLIIWGYNDIVVPRRFAYLLKKDLPFSELKFIHHSGHMPQEETPIQVLKWMKPFLETK